MPRIKKVSKGRLAKRNKRRSTNDSYHDDPEEQDLPSDELGRLKIKRHYEELLGIRLEKLKGRMLNRAKINKSIEGIYFICAECKKVCHNLDDGLVQDSHKKVILCKACAKEKGIRDTAA